MSAAAPVVLLGGTFDPVHNGHLRVAVELLDGLAAHEVRLVPGYIPPHREAPRAGPQARRRMVTAGTAGVPGLGVDDCELQRGGPSYTVATLRQVSAALAPRPVIFALGGDAFASLDRWYRWRELTEYAHLAVMRRPGAEAVPAPALAEWAEARRVDRAEQLRETPRGRILDLPVTPVDVSSTGVRRLIAAGRSARFLMPEAVWSQIASAGTYGYPQL